MIIIAQNKPQGLYLNIRKIKGKIFKELGWGGAFGGLFYQNEPFCASNMESPSLLNPVVWFIFVPHPKFWT